MSSMSPRATKRGAMLSALALIAFALACHSKTRPKPASAEQAAKDASTVTADAIEKDAGKPIEQVLAGRVAGVIVSRTPDGGIAVRMRGGAASSLYGNQAPLYVLDGSPFNPGPGGAIVGVNPYDIESIQVLKNPEDISIYGSRGVNGVILITTKYSQKR